MFDAAAGTRVTCSRSRWTEIIGLKRMRDITLRFSLVLLVTVFALGACDGPSTEILGRWKSTEATNPLVWEFSRGRNVQVGDEPGLYTLNGQNRLQIRTKSATFVYDVEFRPGRMIWKQPNGAVMEVVRTN